MKLYIVCILSLLAIPSAFADTSALKLGGSLFNNGPLITSIGTGIGGNDESVLQNNTLSMTSLGTAHNPGLNLRVAEDFTVSGSPWQINSIDLYSYQTGETASTITNVNLRIWDGNPNNPASSIVFGDTTTNLLNATAFSGILRVDENTMGTADDRQIAISNVSVNTQLPPGTYWLDWQSDGSGNAGPFVPHITILGQTTTGNALISTDNGVAYNNLQDNGTSSNQGLPFEIYGSVVGTGTPTTQSVPTLNLFSTFILILMLLLFVYMSLFRQAKTNQIRK